MNRLLNMSIVFTLLLVTIFGASSVSAAGNDNAVFVTGIIEVDAEGKVETARFTSSELRPAIEEQVLDAVRGWTFNPFLVDGVARRIRTSMNLKLELVHQGDQAVLRFAEKDFGQPVLVSAQPPRYPASSLSRRHQASLVMAMTLADDGSVISAEPVSGEILGERATESRQRTLLQPFVTSAVAAVRNWRYDFVEPSSGGAPQRFLVSLTFTVSPARRPGRGVVNAPVLYDAAATLGQPLDTLLARQAASNAPFATLSLNPGLTLREDSADSTLSL